VLSFSVITDDLILSSKDEHFSENKALVAFMDSMPWTGIIT
jgi:hypothetical protein